MALEATGFVCSECSYLTSIDRPVRVVAVDARHCAFGQPVRVRLPELCPSCCVASAALLIDLARLSKNHALRIAMHGMAGCTRHLAAAVTSKNAAGMRGLFEMTSKAGLVGVDAGKSTRVDNVFGRVGFTVLASGTVTGLANLTLPAPASTELYRVVGVLLESVKNILVTGLAYLRSDICSWLVRQRRDSGFFGGLDRLRLRRNGEAKKERPCEQPHNSGSIAISLTGHSEHVAGRS